MRLTKRPTSLIVLLLLISSVTVTVLQAQGEELHANAADLYFAKTANIQAWGLLQKKRLTTDERQALLSAALASRYHWSKVGKIVNIQRANWLVSHVFSRLSQGELALEFAKTCFKQTTENREAMQDFDIAYASEAMARALFLTGDKRQAKAFYDAAISLGKKIEDEADKKLFFEDFNNAPWQGI